jgi:arsenate reductase-like glutaredoxin family protein
MTQEFKFEDLKGKTLVEIIGQVGDDSITFIDSAGDSYNLYHEQDCCESVSVEEIVGDLADLLNSPLIEAEEVSGAEEPKEFKRDYPPESATWTFYKLGTAKGFVTIRWLGESNGYYSESVYFRKN